ncbi:MAG: DHH family phosphoesterase [bacterium]|nr:DHH family phosphoesterase [bacterium]
MAENVEQQVFDSLNKAKRILVVLPQNPNGDALGAGLALHDFLKKLEKEPEIVTQNRDFGSYSFLPKIEVIKNSLALFQSFVVSVSTKETKLDELSYEVKHDRVEVFLKPKNGRFSPKDITFGNARFPYDLIITLDTPSLEHLGEIYEKNTDLFFETTVINIDHHPNNEHYGEINLVDLTSTSTSEILATLIENFEENLIDKDIATNLLTGIIVETNSFQHVKTTPKAFLRASALIAKGGDHQQIVRELYKTKHIPLLKLWGRALARLKELKEYGMAYSMVNEADFIKSGADRGDLRGVMKELVANLSGKKIILFIAEVAPMEVLGYFYLHPNIKSQIISGALGGEMLNGSLGMFETKGQDLSDVEKDVLEKLQKIKEQIVV